MTTGRLFEYTKFHVGLYASLVFGTVALLSIGKSAGLGEPLVLYLATYAVGAWVVAGFCGGTILGNLVEFEGPLCCFRAERWGLGKKVPGRVWESIEHISFWIGVLSALGAAYFTIDVASYSVKMTGGS